VIVEALATELRLNPQVIVQERQQLRIGYGEYAALRGLAYIGRGSLQRIADDYQRGRAWSDIAANHGSRINDVRSWVDGLIRTTNNVGRQLKNQQFRPSTRLR
jgi:hypothetical protein